MSSPIFFCENKKSVTHLSSSKFTSSMQRQYDRISFSQNFRKIGLDSDSGKQDLIP